MFGWESGGGGGNSGSRDEGGDQLTVQLCLQKLISSAPRNNQKQKFPNVWIQPWI